MSAAAKAAPLAIGFIGVGVIGGGMARRALAEGHRAAVHDLRRDVVDELAKAGAIPCASAREVAARSDYVVVSLPRREDVHSAFFGANGLLEGLRAGSVVIETSSIPPEGIGEFAEAVKARGARMIDAPLCPSQSRERPHRPVPASAAASNAAGHAAQAGNFCFFAGGDAADVAAARPVLDLLGIETHHVGPLGAGKLVKLLHNAINITALAAIAETMVVAKRSGLDIKVVTDALTTSLADSAMLRIQGRGYIAAQHFPKGLFPLPFSEKDLAYALECAQKVGVTPTVIGATHDLYARAVQSKYREYYNPAIFRFIEDEAG